ncbi:MAG: hypothetical protein JXB46_03755 [Candidatus Eisenbacteria bacterium]|nr:hypothetical protein [Candidatus Eisenbacteria bacterium]
MRMETIVHAASPLCRDAVWRYVDELTKACVGVSAAARDIPSGRMRGGPVVVKWRSLEETDGPAPRGLGGEADDELEVDDPAAARLVAGYLPTIQLLARDRSAAQAFMARLEHGQDEQEKEGPYLAS